LHDRGACDQLQAMGRLVCHSITIRVLGFAHCIPLLKEGNEHKKSFDLME
jgi:hypothetical protein